MNKFVFVTLLILMIMACSLVPQVATNNQVSVSDLETAAVSTAFAQMTAQAPTKTPRPTSTPAPGSFSNPAPIGSTLILWDAVHRVKMGATLIGVERGEVAKQRAKQVLQGPYFSDYEEPIVGQEYLTAYLHIEYLETDDPNTVQSIDPYWHFTLRYSEEDYDVWAVNALDTIAEGYVPFVGEGWLVFLIRENSDPFLYFQPLLIVNEQVGLRTQGAFFRTK